MTVLRRNTSRINEGRSHKSACADSNPRRSSPTSIRGATEEYENITLLRFDLTFGSLFGIIGAMVDTANRVIVLSISILHLALVLASSAGSVTCVDSDGLVKIEAICEQSCVCEDQTAIATVPAIFDSHDTHEHDDCGDCTDFFLSTFLRLSNHSSRLNSDIGSVNAGTSGLAWSGPYLADHKSPGACGWSQAPPLATQRTASLKTTIVIC